MRRAAQTGAIRDLATLAGRCSPCGGAVQPARDAVSLARAQAAPPPAAPSCRRCRPPPAAHRCCCCRRRTGDHSPGYQRARRQGCAGAAQAGAPQLVRSACHAPGVVSKRDLPVDTLPVGPPCVQLNEVNRKLQSGVVELPPEGERFPQPAASVRRHGHEVRVSGCTWACLCGWALPRPSWLPGLQRSAAGRARAAHHPHPPHPVQAQHARGAVQGEAGQEQKPPDRAADSARPNVPPAVRSAPLPAGLDCRAAERPGSLGTGLTPPPPPPPPPPTHPPTHPPTPTPTPTHPTPHTHLPLATRTCRLPAREEVEEDLHPHQGVPGLQLHRPHHRPARQHAEAHAVGDQHQDCDPWQGYGPAARRGGNSARCCAPGRTQLLLPPRHAPAPPCAPPPTPAGSVKEGAARDPKYDYGEDEELHVLITGDRQEDVSAGVRVPCAFGTHDEWVGADLMAPPIRCCCRWMRRQPWSSACCRQVGGAG